MSFSDIQLSKHFNLLDFMNAHTLYTSGVGITAEDVPSWAIDTGVKLCEELLEPLYAKHGPMSFSSGYIPTSLLKRWTPHSWKPEDGAAADVVVHSWVNQERSPISLVKNMIEEGADFERLITYAGSEVICMSAGRNTNRRAVYENLRVPGQDKPEFITWARAKATPATASFMKDRPEWRRADGETSYHHRGNIRPQHIRVSEHFTLLDFCRDEEAMAAGKNWVPPTREAMATMMKTTSMVASALEPMMAEFGRVSVIKGMRRSDFAKTVEESWRGRDMQVTFWCKNLPKEIIGDRITVISADEKNGGFECVYQIRRG